MVELEHLRVYMRKQAEGDRKRRSVQVAGPTLEEALLQASIELNIPLKQIEYEVLDKGSRGTFGVGKKDCILIAYEVKKEEEKILAPEDFEFSFGAEGAGMSKPADADGEAIIRLYADGAWLKVTPPIGKGRKINDKIVIENLHNRTVRQYDHALISRVVKRAEATFVKVGEFLYNPANDSILTVDITDFEMKAYVIVSPPGPGGADLGKEQILGFMKNNSIVHGVKEEAIDEFLDHPEHGKPILVAEGTKPENGKDAKIIYNFEIDRSKIKLKEKNGRVDFKEMNLVQNVVEGQALAKKVPYEEGTTGRTVTGKLLPAKSGKDVKLNVGKNCRLSEDGMTVIAGINGQVILAAEKINVEPIYVVEGDVDLHSGGNVVFLGTVLVKGSVDDGFKVKAAGNIEVMGNVGKCELDAEGDIIVHQGITGKGGGDVHSGRSVWAKFIENARIEASEYVVASEGIINSQVNANKMIICQGKRATIVGGKLRAVEHIHAKTLGSVAGSETILEVGYDPASKSRLAEMEETTDVIDKEIEEIILNIRTLQNIQREKKKLPEDKAAYLVALTEKHSELSVRKEELLEEIEKLQQYLSSLRTIGKISASGKVFPGVKISIKEAALEVRNEFKAVTFINELSMVKMTKFEELEGDFTPKQ